MPKRTAPKHRAKAGRDTGAAARRAEAKATRAAETAAAREAEMAAARRHNEEYKARQDALAAIPMERLVKALHDKVRTLPRNQQLVGFATGMMALDEKLRYTHKEDVYRWLLTQVGPQESWLGKFADDVITFDGDASDATLPSAIHAVSTTVAGETTEPVPAGPTAVASVAPQEQ
jgi:hypothetical protein